MSTHDPVDLTNERPNPDGSWSPATPLAPGRAIRIERWLRQHRLRRIADLLAALDERGLGR